jgi:hypothetical protein
MLSYNVINHGSPEFPDLPASCVYRLSSQLDIFPYGCGSSYFSHWNTTTRGYGVAPGIAWECYLPVLGLAAASCKHSTSLPPPQESLMSYTGIRRQWGDGEPCIVSL